ncbi:putative tubulin--tyrosine ligase pby1 [Malassezia sp. CBS 17886]|nr:putative tubulin--tyrosine ligase pby1 [Malassezia sp. CBS 17886]
MPTAWVCFPGAAYTAAAAAAAAQRVLVPAGWRVATSDGADEAPLGVDAYIADYDLLPFEHLLGSDTPCSSYVIRKALIRKHYLAHILHTHHVKQGATTHTPQTWTLDIQFADELDELLADDLYDLRDELAENVRRAAAGAPLSWYILKPGMADQGNGIRLFASQDRLLEIFEEFGDEDEDEDGDDMENARALDGAQAGGARRLSDAGSHDQDLDPSTSVLTSQLRHFVIQKYIHPPLLNAPDGAEARKFHLRVYVICVGGLQVYLHNDMLALFAPAAYEPPRDDADLRGHLSNTCLGARQGGDARASVFLFDALQGTKIQVDACGATREDVLSAAHCAAVHEKAAATIGEVFGAVAREASIHWQMWPSAFEIFGVDLLVGCDMDALPAARIPPEALQVWLLEVNAQPDFAQSGPGLHAVVEHVFARAMQLGVLREGGESWPVGERRDRCTRCFAGALIKGR